MSIDTLADALRHILRYSASFSVIRTFDGQWQANVRRGTARNAYGVFVHPDPIEAIRLTASSYIDPSEKPIDVTCNACGDTGWRYGEIGTPCICRQKDLFGDINK